MKNFLKDFFRPLDNLIFNYLVKIGGIKCIDPVTMAVGGQILGGIFGSRSAKKAARQRAEAIKNAYAQFRDPTVLIREQYGGRGIYSPAAMQTVLRREQKLIPQFQKLAELRATGSADILRDIQEESKMRQLGLIGALGEDIRETLQDPRTARIAELDIEEAERLSEEAAGVLGPEAARTATQAAFSAGQSLGRGLDASTLARAALGRESAQRARRQEAAGARQRALTSAGQARIDPFQFLFGTPSAEERMTSAFLTSPLGTQVTDPGQAFNIGSQIDLRKAQALLGEGSALAQGTATSGAILGQSIANIGSTLGSMSGPSSMQTPTGAQVASYGQNLLNQAGQLSNQISNIGNIGLTGNPMQQSTPFGGYTIPIS